MAGVGNVLGNNSMLSNPLNCMSGRFDSDFTTEALRRSDETCDIAIGR
jgi:hypothetical protein